MRFSEFSNGSGGWSPDELARIGALRWQYTAPAIGDYGSNIESWTLVAEASEILNGLIDTIAAALESAPA